MAKVEHMQNDKIGNKTVRSLFLFSFCFVLFLNRRFYDEEKPKYLRSFASLLLFVHFRAIRFFFYLEATVSINMFALHLAYSDQHHQHRHHHKKKLLQEDSYIDRSNKNHRD